MKKVLILVDWRHLLRYNYNINLYEGLFWYRGVENEIRVLSDFPSEAEY